MLVSSVEENSPKAKGQAKGQDSPKAKGQAKGQDSPKAKGLVDEEKVPQSSQMKDDLLATDETNDYGLNLSSDPTRAPTEIASPSLDAARDAEVNERDRGLSRSLRNGKLRADLRSTAEDPARRLKQEEGNDLAGSSEDSAVVRQMRSCSSSQAIDRKVPLEISRDKISSYTERLFANKPVGFPRRPSPIVIDSFQHGQFVWWNRFLANRKKSRGYSTGYHVGRVIDLDSEWFPSVDLTDIKKRLRLQAAQLGRRSVFIQSMDDLRYMAIPPRAITAFPDPDAARDLIMFEGCKFNSIASYRGLLRAQMVKMLRNHVGELNTLLEIELLNLFFHSQEEDSTSTEEEIKFLENTNVWEVLRTRRVKPSEFVPDESSLICPPTSSAMPAGRKLSTTQQMVETPSPTDEQAVARPVRGGRQKSGRRRKAERDENDTVPAVEEEEEHAVLDPLPQPPPPPSRAKRRRIPSMVLTNEDAATEGLNELEPHHSIKRSRSKEIPGMEKWIEICKELCLTRKQVQHLFRGVPCSLLASSTGIPWPEDIEKTSISILKTYLRMPSHSVSPCSDCHRDTTNLIVQHICAANLLLHRLAKTLVIRIPIKCPSSPPVGSNGFVLSSTPSIPLNPAVPNLFVDQPTMEYASPIQDDMMHQTASDFLHGEHQPRDDQPETQLYDIAFCTDHGHVNMPKASPKSADLMHEPSVQPYPCHEPFTCVSYHLGFWACLLRLDPFLRRGGEAGMIRTTPSSSISGEDGLASHVTDTQWPMTDAYCPNQSQDYGEPQQQRGFDDGAIWQTPYPTVKCVKSTLLLVGCCGTDSSASSYYSIKLSQISSKKPTEEEFISAARKFLGSRNEKFSIVEMEKRLQRLYDLKDAASQLRSIFEDETAFLYQTKGKMTLRDVRYFESLWKELLKKLK